MEEGKEDVRINFSAGGFYGSELSLSAISTKQQERLAQVCRGAEYINHHPLPSEYRPGILGPPATWKVFKRQAEAIKLAQVMGEGLMVFSFEGDAMGGGGRRNFVVTHPAQMWVRQSEKVADKRCVYEVIQEKSVCKLYFDLEFMFASNPSKDGVDMTNNFIRIVCHFLHKEFDISCSRKDIIDLKGTSDLKFSRHLIFNIPGVAFGTNGHVGYFVKMVCGKVRLWKEGKEAIQVSDVSLQNVKDLFVLDSKGNEVLFCDEGVYSKNRNFRLFLSTKYGQNSPLIIAEENQYSPNYEPTDKHIFLDSLITLVDYKCKILTYKDTEQNPKESKYTSNSKINKVSDVEGFSQSPYPEIDEFIQSIINLGNIHSWHYFSQSEVIVYNIVRYRYCHNISREHKSNNIMYVVSVKDASYYQKCHDPDCRDFRSPSWPLPKDTVFWQNMNEEEMMDWIQSVEEEHDETLKLNHSDNELERQLVDAAEAIEKWEHVEDFFSSLSSTDKSIRSSQGSSQSSNPWYRLSELSSPSTSFMENTLQLSQSFSLEDKDQNEEPGSYVFYDVLPDQEFLEAVYVLEEQLLCVENEMEISC